MYSLSRHFLPFLDFQSMTLLSFLIVFVRIFDAIKKKGQKSPLRKWSVRVCRRRWHGLSTFLWRLCWCSPRSTCLAVALLANSLLFWAWVLSLAPTSLFVLRHRFWLLPLGIFPKRAKLAFLK